MYRLGHIGIALLVLAPLSYGLVEAHNPLLVLIIVLGVLVVEPLPDFDFKVSFLSHRGTSHSLLAAVSIGGLLALCGWFVGVQVVTVLASVLGATSEVVATVATSLASLAPPEAIGNIVAWLIGLLTVVVATLDWIASQLQVLDQQTIAGVGFVIGAGGIFVHLLGDVLTVSGIRPLLPFSRWKLSLSSLRANNTLANTGLFACGVLAVAVVLATTIAGLGFTVAPASLSPIGTTSAQDAFSDAQNGTVTSNETHSNQTSIQTQNTANSHSSSSANVSAPATVVFRNQTTNGTSVTIRSVTLPEGGFVAIHASSYLGPAPADATVIAVSQYLSPGTHREVTIDISHAPPANYLGLNRSQLNSTQTLVTALYRDLNANQRFEYVQSAGERDPPIRRNGSAIADAALVRVPTPPRQIASVVFRNQTLQNNTLTVAHARLADGGFLIAHNASYLRTGDPLTSAVGLSRYLPPGNYANITVRLLPDAISRTQVVTLRPVRDTNGNQRYDYVESGGLEDTGYLMTNRSATVADRALVRVPAPETQTRTRPRPPTLTETPSLTPTATVTPTPTATPVPTTSTVATLTPGTAQESGSGSNGLLDALGLSEIGGVLLVVVAGLVLVVGLVIVREVR